MGKDVQIKFRVRPSMVAPWMLQECETTFFGLVHDWYNLRGYNTKEEAITAQKECESIVGCGNDYKALKTQLNSFRTALAQIEAILLDELTLEDDRLTRVLYIAETALKAKSIG
jgi:hypothetical protein